MTLKENIEKTLLIEPEIKSKLLSIKGNLPEELEKYLSDFFDKYEEREKNIIDDILTMVPIMYLKTLQDLEREEKQKEENSILEMEKQIEELG